MRRLLALSLLVAFVVGALWLKARREGERENTPSAAVGAAPEPDERTVEIARTATVPVESEAVSSAGAARTPLSNVTSTARAAAAPRTGLSGHVLRPDGAPVGGAEVELENDGPFRSKLAPLASTLTKADGSFSFVNTYADPLDVRAIERRGGVILSYAAIEHVPPTRTDLELVLPAPCALRGRVVDDVGQPVTDFRIGCEPVDPGSITGGRWPGRTFHEAQGTFVFDALPSFECWLKVTGAGHSNGELRIALPREQPLEIVLVRQATVRGIVWDPSGHPTPVSRVDAAPGPAGTLTNTSGRFEIQLDPGPDVELWASGASLTSGPHFVASEHKKLTLAPGQKLDNIQLHLLAPGHVSGEVLGLGGRPLSGRAVKVTHQVGTTSWACGDGWFEDDPITDEAGRFELDVLPGHIALEIEPTPVELETLRTTLDPLQSLRSLCGRTVTVGAGESVHVRVTLEGKPVRVHGRIELGDRPLAEVDAFVTNADAMQRATVRDGSYELLLPAPGKYKLTLESTGLRCEPVLDVPEADDYRFDLALPLQRLSGHVRDAGGKPLAGVAIDAVHEKDGPHFACSGNALTDQDGAYSVELVCGSYRVHPLVDAENETGWLEAEDRHLVLESDTRLEDVDFELRAGGMIEGIVLRESGTPASGALVLVTGVREDDVKSATTDEAGRFRIRPLASGRYWIRSTRDIDASPATTLDALAVELGEGRAETVELRLTPCTRVRVRILDADGAPAHVPLEAVDPHGRSLLARRIDPAVQTLLLVPPGPYTLRAKNGTRLFEQRISLADGASELEVEFRLE